MLGVLFMVAMLAASEQAQATPVAFVAVGQGSGGSVSCPNVDVTMVGVQHSGQYSVAVTTVAPAIPIDGCIPVIPRVFDGTLVLSEGGCIPSLVTLDGHLFLCVSALAGGAIATATWKVCRAPCDEGNELVSGEATFVVP
jgi:hypothetical protein